LDALDTFKNLDGRHLIDGRLVAGTGPSGAAIIDPATELKIGQIVDATAAEIDLAVEVANVAQKRWRKINYHKRAELLHDAARKMRETRTLVGEMLTREMGKPFKESVDEVIWSSTATDYYAEVGRHEAGRVLGPVVDGQFNFTTKDPLGVVVIILPFNYPLCLLCWQAAAALATGNAVIDTGRRVAEACARLYKRSLIETSGNDPFIVMPSAPIDTAARGAAFGAYLNCGQVCAAAERFFVHDKVYAEFVDKLVGYTREVRVGNGLEKVDMGPLASERELRRYLGILRRAKEQGIKVAAGGGRPANLQRGWFVEPSVLVDVPADADIMNQESFGPVAPVCRVASFDEAIALANRSRYALGSTVYTTDLNETMRAVEEIEAGMVWINAPLLDNDAGPFGGRKQSGMGRQLGAEGLDTFRHTKFSMIDPAANPHDFWWFPYSDAESFPDRNK